MTEGDDNGWQSVAEGGSRRTAATGLRSTSGCLRCFGVVLGNLRLKGGDPFGDFIVLGMQCGNDTLFVLAYAQTKGTRQHAPSNTDGNFFARRVRVTLIERGLLTGLQRGVEQLKALLIEGNGDLRKAHRLLLFPSLSSSSSSLLLWFLLHSRSMARVIQSCSVQAAGLASLLSQILA